MVSNTNRDERFVFQVRYFDASWNCWSDFEDEDFCFSDQIDEHIDRWKDQSYQYSNSMREYKIIKRIEEITWQPLK